MLAKEQVDFPTENKWKLCQTEHIENSFPGYLFFYIDGTVREIWSPKDLKKYRSAFNSKQSICSFSFFIMVTGNRFITYVSAIDTGNTHDAITWNTALGWPISLFPNITQTGRE